MLFKGKKFKNVAFKVWTVHAFIDLFLCYVIQTVHKVTSKGNYKADVLQEPREMEPGMVHDKHLRQLVLFIWFLPCHMLFSEHI